MLAAIAAMAENRVIGRHGVLPWRLPDEMAHFKRTTLGRVCVMGRATFDEGGTPLKGRTSIVITRDPSWANDGVRVAHSVDEALGLAQELSEEGLGKESLSNPDRCPVVIGGGQIYAAALGRVGVLDLTTVHADLDGDTVFPDVPESDWTEVRRVFHEQDERHAHAFSIVRLMRTSSIGHELS